MKEEKGITPADKSLNSKNGFTVAAVKKTAGSNESLVKQNTEYELKITQEGKQPYFKWCNWQFPAKVNDNKEHIIVGVKE